MLDLFQIASSIANEFADFPVRASRAPLVGYWWRTCGCREQCQEIRRLPLARGRALGRSRPFFTGVPCGGYRRDVNAHHVWIQMNLCTSIPT